MTRRRNLVPIAFALCISMASHVGAQSDQERAGARAAARDGIEAFNRGDYEEALRLLERAQSLVDAPTHLLFIARSRVKLGKLVEAREAYKKIITANLAPNAPHAFLAAQEVAPGELAEIEARIAKLKVDVTGPKGQELSDLVIKVNGLTLSSALVGLSVPANPGTNEILVTAAGMRPVTKTVELDEGGSGTINVALEPDPSAPAPAEQLGAEEASSPPDAAPAEPTAPTSEGNPKRTIGWVTASTGAAVALTGGVFGALSMAQLTGARSDETLCGPEKSCTPDGRDEVNAAKTKALVADISMGVGIIAVGIGTYLIVTSKPNAQRVGLRSVVPSLDQHGGALLMKGGF